LAWRAFAALLAAKRIEEALIKIEGTTTARRPDAGCEPARDLEHSVYRRSGAAAMAS
jgi:hypothetical protein